jgi:hypothetical protein
MRGLPDPNGLLPLRRRRTVRHRLTQQIDRNHEDTRSRSPDYVIVIEAAARR